MSVAGTGSSWTLSPLDRVRARHPVVEVRRLSAEPEQDYDCSATVLCFWHSTAWLGLTTAPWTRLALAARLGAGVLRNQSAISRVSDEPLRSRLLQSCAEESAAKLQQN